MRRLCASRMRAQAKDARAFPRTGAVGTARRTISRDGTRASSARYVCFLRCSHLVQPAHLLPLPSSCAPCQQIAKDEQAEDVEADGSAAQSAMPQGSGVPSATILVSGLASDSREATIHRDFCAFAPVTEVRLARDPATSAPRGWALVVFGSAEHATHTLHTIRDRLLGQLSVDGCRVTVAYARPGACQRATHSTFDTKASPNPIAAAALEQAHWSLMGQSAASSSSTSSGSSSNLPLPPPPVHAREWPPTFESDGAAWVLEPASGYYYEQASAFYYDSTNKLYFNSRTGTYFRHDAVCSPPFVPFVPPAPPVTDAAAAVNAAQAPPPLLAEASAAAVEATTTACAAAASAAATEAAVPAVAPADADIEELFDPTHNRCYFRNKTTGKTGWMREEVAAAEPTGAVQAAAISASQCPTSHLAVAAGQGGWKLACERQRASEQA